MYPLELRTCVLGTVVAVLLGAGVGVGWHFLADSAGAATSVAAVARPIQRDAPSPSPQMSCPPGPRAPGPREASRPDVPSLPALAHPNNRPDATQARSELKVTHAVHAKRARQEAPSDRADGDERNPSDRGAFRPGNPSQLDRPGASGFVSHHQPTMPRKFSLGRQDARVDPRSCRRPSLGGVGAGGPSHTQGVGPGHLLAGSGMGAFVKPPA